VVDLTTQDMLSIIGAKEVEIFKLRQTVNLLRAEYDKLSQSKAKVAVSDG